MNHIESIHKVIRYIHQHMHESLSLSKLAECVSYSPYHFTRIFKKQTGLSPLYYVSSLRLQLAKNLLLETDMSIRDIGMEIGQQSLGTFTTRFTEKVGMTPSTFRHSKYQAERTLHCLQTLPQGYSLAARGRYQQVKGTVQTEEPFEGIVLIGLFPKPIPEGIPIYGTLLTSLGDQVFTI